MSNIPFKEDNPDGLHKRYLIKKYKGKRFIRQNFFGQDLYEPVFEDVDENAEYFVLRLDDGGDKNHIAACRKAILTYAENIAEFIPGLAKDLINRYGEEPI